MIASWVLGAKHSLEPLDRAQRALDDALALQLLNAGILWVIYIALEPYVRRYCPEILMSWSRLLGGRVRDARVGRDLLVGVFAGVGVQFLRFGLLLLPGLLGYAPPPPRGTNLAFLLGTRQALSMLLTNADECAVQLAGDDARFRRGPRRVQAGVAGRQPFRA